MKRRGFVQGTSIRKQVLRQRRIHTSLAAQWETLRSSAEGVRKDLESLNKPVGKPAHG